MKMKLNDLKTELQTEMIGLRIEAVIRYIIPMLVFLYVVGRILEEKFKGVMATVKTVCETYVKSKQVNFNAINT